jgi:hypothetical protein
MGLWWFDVETIARVAYADRDLDRLGRALHADEHTVGAAASTNTRAGVVAARFEVDAPDAVPATGRGVHAPRDAPVSSGLPPGVPVKITLGLIPSEDPP